MEKKTRHYLRCYFNYRSYRFPHGYNISSHEDFTLQASIPRVSNQFLISPWISISIPRKFSFELYTNIISKLQLFIVLIFLHLLVRDEISEGRASFHRGFDSLDAKILFRVNIIPILFPSYIIYRSNLFIFLEIFRRVKARIRSARDRREGEEEWEEEWEEGRGTKFIVRQTTRTSRRRKYPGAEEFVTTSAPRMLLFSSSLCVARWFRAVLSERPSASLMHAFRYLFSRSRG